MAVPLHIMLPAYDTCLHLCLQYLGAFSPPTTTTGSTPSTSTPSSCKIRISWSDYTGLKIVAQSLLAAKHVTNLSEKQREHISVLVVEVS